MATEKIVIQIGDEIKELKGAEKDAYIKQRELDNTEIETLKTQEQTQEALKISAYTKLGLTKEEIKAIL
jgi:beta-lactamase class D